MSGITKGYPYAFQMLGVLSFKNEGHLLTDSIVDQLKTELFAYAYEKIWEELSEGDRELIKLCLYGTEVKRSEIISRMKKPQNYSAYRNRLLRRGLITVRQGHISLSLPFFNEYVEEYGFTDFT